MPTGTPAMVGDDPDNTYEIIVKATDGNVSPNTTENTREYPVTVTVTNVDETPEITGSELPSFAEIEYDATSPVLTVETYTARDEEGESIEWSVDGTDMGDFSIDSSTGVLSFAQRPNYEMADDDDTDNTYEIIVKATDGDTSVPNLTNITEYHVTITVTDVNERPDIHEDSVPDYVEVDFYFTGTPADVHTFTATDYDDGDTFEWSLLGDDAGDLEIDPSTGVLTFTQDSSLNVGPLPSFEDPQDQDEDSAYDITVVATDNHGKAGEYAVTITVSDAEEATVLNVKA